MYCKECGFQLSDDTKFCPNCGTKVEMNGVGNIAKNAVWDSISAECTNKTASSTVRDKDNVSTKIKAIITCTSGIDQSEVTESSRLKNDLGIDSLDIVELIMAIEKEFGINIPDEMQDKYITVRDVIDDIKYRLR